MEWPGEARSNLRATGHYPTHLIDVRSLGNSRRLMLRPVLPQDSEALADMVNRLSEPSRRRRFPNAALPASADAMRALTCVDHARHVALVVALQEGQCEHLVADARYRIDESDGRAELALVVDDAWQRRGVATWALLALGRAACAAGIDRLHCDVPAENEPMLALMRHCRFRCMGDPADPGIVHVEAPPHELMARRSPRDTKASGWIHRLLGDAGPASLSRG
ncbi:GNAT family N-acetyltransferase [Variovorax sp. J22R133]|uniref:GNAT family N-acetyltransferase n=1 Tax=Variovorax brevis TaxID=3053503 RepID=UPI002575B1B4|nr:GNAT family N-acetyltransferase [Variovorax sp. J22R133]MDM0114828.1 GNAT family N-acetyltransferase [Variovorax sp. J22R133]